MDRQKVGERAPISSPHQGFARKVWAKVSIRFRPSKQPPRPLRFLEETAPNCRSSMDRQRCIGPVESTVAPEEALLLPGQPRPRLQAARQRRGHPRIGSPLRPRPAPGRRWLSACQVKDFFIFFNRRDPRLQLFGCAPAALNHRAFRLPSGSSGLGDQALQVVGFGTTQQGRMVKRGTPMLQDDQIAFASARCCHEHIQEIAACNAT